LGKVIYKTDEEEVELIRTSCLLVCKVLAHVASRIKPGITGDQLDREAEELIRDHNAEPGFKGYRGFPSTLCISVNEGVVHGIPSKTAFKDGDVVSVDCGSYLNDFFGDAAAIDNAVVGKRLGDISYAVQQYCERENKYGVVRELVGHGIGKNLHEPPEVPNFGKRGKGQVLRDGLVIAIEPMVNLGRKEVRGTDDGWTIITKDRKPSAHFEHTVVVRKDKADILSSHKEVEENIKNNAEVREVSIKS